MRNIPFSKSSKLSDFEPDDIGGTGDATANCIVAALIDDVA